MSKGFFLKSNEIRRAGRKPINPTNRDLILQETFKKETKHAKLYTEFSSNYVKMEDIITGKITDLEDDELFSGILKEEMEKLNERNNEKRTLTTSSDYGSFDGPLATKLDYSPLEHARIKCDVTKLAECQLQILRDLRKTRNDRVDNTSSDDTQNTEVAA